MSIPPPRCPNCSVTIRYHLGEGDCAERVERFYRKWVGDLLDVLEGIYETAKIGERTPDARLDYLLDIKEQAAEQIRWRLKAETSSTT